jgi:FtsZ-interacting cell division protein ZipA
VLARITYLLVIIALGCLIGGFFTRESNVLLFISIGLSVVAIALVLVGWARRAREAPLGFDEDLAYAGDDDDDALVDALSDEELAFVEERTSRRSRRPKASAARPRTKPKTAKPKPKPKAKAKPAAGRTAKSTAKPAKSTAKPAKPKATRKPQARPKRKPPRPRPETP